MSASFLSRMINGPFGDPGVLVDMRWQGVAALFDLGRNDGVPAGDLLRVRFVFVSHTHMDHFVGFDRVLRLFLSRDETLQLWGPAGIGDCVEGKLRGYIWNLTESYSFAFDVTEVTETGFRRWKFRAATGFQREELEPVVYPPVEDGSEGRRTPVLYQDENFQVRCAITDHKIPCLSFAIEEPTHLNVDPVVLREAGFQPGRWLQTLKTLIRNEAPDDTMLDVQRIEGGSTGLSIGELRRLVRITSGQKLGYVVDTRFMPENLAVLLPVLHRADVLFCESPFLDADRDQAARRYHLTAAEAGAIGRMARVHRLKVFHYSPRYQGRGDTLRDEAEASFRGRIDPGVLADLAEAAG